MKTWRQQAARWAYAGLLQLLTLPYLVRLWHRGRREPLYRHALGERLGRYATAAGTRAASSSGWVWIHAVSLGETRAAQALVDALRVLIPGMRLLLTHSTATGREAGAALLLPGDTQAWLPFDTPGATRRFFQHFQPAVGVLMETEIWPNLLWAAQAAGVPMVLANARLSQRSLERGLRWRALLSPATQTLRSTLAQTEADAQRLRHAGAKHVSVCGNLKFDLQPHPALVAQGRAWRQALKRHVLLAAVTREGEETLLLQAWQQQGQLPNVLLLIVPRHPQRFDDVHKLITQAGLTVARRSSWGAAPPPQALQAQVWLGDSMQEMPLYYGAAQVALLGGSFAPLGGQNLIEAAACGCPVFMGPHTFNFEQAAELALLAGAAFRVATMGQAVQEATQLLHHPQRLATCAGQALHFATQHQGAAQRMAQNIGELLRPASANPL
jgi:3-deoxy-D-manno-octulosonic-acid transferase